MKHKQEIHVCCAIIVNQGKVLAVKRSQSMPMPGLWEFPGGKIEAGETEKEALVREIREELSVDIFPGMRLEDQIWETEEQVVRLIPFYAELRFGTPRLNEHASMQWLSPLQLRALHWTPADIPVMEEVIRNLASSV